jgi:hypothetical protein
MRRTITTTTACTAQKSRADITLRYTRNIFLSTPYILEFSSFMKIRYHFWKQRRKELSATSLQSELAAMGVTPGGGGV